VLAHWVKNASRANEVLGPVTQTGRGFNILRFADRYNVACSLQESSLATEAAIWLGVEDPDPKIMIRDAFALGLTPNTGNGWMPYPMPAQVLCNTRMHLNRRQVHALIGHLKTWLETGDFN
jgi:hypothetical protein